MQIKYAWVKIVNNIICRDNIIEKIGRWKL
jgi:hypothetical protein